MLEPSAATGINGDQVSKAAPNAGAVYVFTRTGDVWTQQAFVKPSNTRAQSNFGAGLALSGDGNTLAVGTFRETSADTGINGNQADTSATGAGAVYVFTRTGATWAQQACIKASNTRTNGFFGWSVALTGDGNTLAVGSPGDSSGASGVDANQADTSATNAGAAYVFTRTAATWTQQSYVKALFTRAYSLFGSVSAASTPSCRERSAVADCRG